MSLIDETTKPKIATPTRKASGKKRAPQTLKAIEAIEKADAAAAAEAEGAAQKKKKEPAPTMRESYGSGQEKEIVSDLFAVHISKWKRLDPKKTTSENMAAVAEAMVTCATRIGSHSAKLQNSRIHCDVIPPFVAKDAEGDELPVHYMGGVDGLQQIGYAMVEPIYIEGENRPRSLFERIRDRPDLSDPLVAKFLAAVPEEDRIRIRRAACRERLQSSEEVPTENLAVVYVPDENFEDTLLTPLQAKSYFMTINEIRWMKPEEEQSFMRPLRHSEVIEHTVVAKKNNIGTMSGERTRVMTYLPKVSDWFSAAVYRYMSGGQFPRLREERLPDLVIRATELFETTQGPTAYTNTHIRNGIVTIVSMMRQIAQAHIDQVLTVAEDEFGWQPEARRVPSTKDLLMTYRHPTSNKEDRKRVLNFLSSETFQTAFKRS
jgi:hypothetical protein